MKVSDFDYDLPARFIAQTPAEPRDSSRLLHCRRASDGISHHHFRDLPNLLQAGDALVLNDTRVIPARLHAMKDSTGGKAEILLLRKLDERRWSGLIRGRNIKPGSRLRLADGTGCQIEASFERGKHIVAFDRPIDELLSTMGEIPLPPYIRDAKGGERYQTVYSAVDGSAAAPTAGLHFTPGLMRHLREMGVVLATCTLHIGLDTFQPVAVDEVARHKIHSEYISLSAETAAIVNEAKRDGRRVIAVGTTSARTLESAAVQSETGESIVAATTGDTELFIRPGYRWRVVDGMITNFHLPRSTLLMMLSAFVGRERLLEMYEIAKREGYRFYSFGDAMLIT